MPFCCWTTTFSIVPPGLYVLSLQRYCHLALAGCGSQSSAAAAGTTNSITTRPHPAASSRLTLLTQLRLAEDGLSHEATLAVVRASRPWDAPSLRCRRPTM